MCPSLSESPVIFDGSKRGSVLGSTNDSLYLLVKRGSNISSSGGGTTLKKEKQWVVRFIINQIIITITNNCLC